MNDYEWNLYSSKYDYLEHHGILGQKWGVRRYQNEDGTLTAAGRKKLYGSGIESFKARTKRGIESGVQRDLSNKYSVKASNYAAKGNMKKAAKVKDLSKKAATNSELYAKGLSKSERAYADRERKLANTQNKAAIIGGVIGGIPAAAMSAVATRAVNSITNTDYKESKKAAKAAYEQYKNAKIKELYKDI